MILTDLVIIIILIIGVSAIIGINIINLIDKKLSYITINIPSFEVPQPRLEIVKPVQQSSDKASNKVEGFDNVPLHEKMYDQEKIPDKNNNPINKWKDCVSDESDSTESMCSSCAERECDCHNREITQTNVEKWEKGNRKSCCFIKPANNTDNLNEFPADRTEYKILYDKTRIEIPYASNKQVVGN